MGNYESFPLHHRMSRSPEHGSNVALKYLTQGKVLAQTRGAGFTHEVKEGPPTFPSNSFTFASS